MPLGASQDVPRHRIDYITPPLDSVTAVVQRGVDINLDLSLRQGDHSVVVADICITPTTNSPGATRWP
eukprot:5936426-Pyramimonas_sp.AAC.1